jgi:hypothetical protein
LNPQQDVPNQTSNSVHAAVSLPAASENDKEKAPSFYFLDIIFLNKIDNNNNFYHERRRWQPTTQGMCWVKD